MLQIGDTFKEEWQFTQENVNIFAKISGDNNPIHIDEVFAATTIFKRPIVHGFFAGAVFSKVFGMQFPGAGTIYMFQEMKFMAPVFVNEAYVALFEITEINREKHTAVISCVLRNAAGKDCIIGSAKLKNDTQF